MNIYIKSQKGNMLVEKGKILIIGGAKGTSLLTGDNEINLIAIAGYKDEKTAWEVFGHLVDRIINPSDKEIEKGIVFIDLEQLEKNI